MIWRHGVRRVPLAYSPAYWGMVFPLGMYGACTWHLAGVTGLVPLQPSARAFAYLALAAWLITGFGMGRSLLRSLTSSAPPETRAAGKYQVTVRVTILKS